MYRGSKSDYFTITYGILINVNDRSDFARPNQEGNLVWSDGFITKVYDNELCHQNPKEPVKIVSPALPEAKNNPDQLIVKPFDVTPKVAEIPCIITLDSLS